jgi:hypothetical protein
VEDRGAAIGQTTGGTLGATDVFCNLFPGRISIASDGSIVVDGLAGGRRVGAAGETVRAREEVAVQSVKGGWIT